MLIPLFPMFYPLVCTHISIFIETLFLRNARVCCPFGGDAFIFGVFVTKNLHEN